MRSPVCCDLRNIAGDDGEEMKTLGEVIKNLEDGTDHLSAILISKDTWNDALHYLKEYQDMLKSPGKMVEYLRQSSMQRSKDLARERAKK